MSVAPVSSKILSHQLRLKLHQKIHLSENWTKSTESTLYLAIPSEIYPNETEETVSKPQWLKSSDWYLYQKADNTTAVAFNLTWSHGGENFAAATGYVLTIAPTYSRQIFLFMFTVKLSHEIRPKHRDKVFINYPCFGRSNNEQIREDRVYWFKLRSLPAYHDNTDHRINEEDFYISMPDCSHEKMQLTAQCMEEESTNDYDDDNDDDDDDDDYNHHYHDDKYKQGPAIGISSGHLALIVVLAFLMTSLLVGVLFLFARRKSKTCLSGANKSILFLVSEQDDGSTYLSHAGLLSDIFKTHGSVSVKSYVWENSTVLDPHSWLKEKLGECNHVVLICTPAGKRSWEINEDVFSLGIKFFLNERQKLIFSRKHAFFFVYFDDDRASCIPELARKEKTYHIPTSLCKFFYRLTGKRPKFTWKELQSADERSRLMSTCNGESGNGVAAHDYEENGTIETQVDASNQV